MKSSKINFIYKKAQLDLIKVKKDKKQINNQYFNNNCREIVILSNNMLKKQIYMYDSKGLQATRVATFKLISFKIVRSFNSKKRYEDRMFDSTKTNVN